MTLQRKATIASSSVAIVLTLIKLTIGIGSGSVAVLASAIDSILDAFVSIFNYFAIYNSEKPADKKFNYGRGKIEALASVIEGTIITISGLYLLYEAINKYINKESTLYINESIIIMVISFAITLLLVIFLSYVAKKTNSMVIKADALHYKTDVFSNGAVLFSLFAVNLTGIEEIDIIVGAGIAFYIIYSAKELIQNGVNVLLDKAIDASLKKDIIGIIINNKKINKYHLFKSRESANTTFIEVHLVFDNFISLKNAHDVCEEIEKEIKNLDKNKVWVITIHMDPYDDSEENLKSLGINGNLL